MARQRVKMPNEWAEFNRWIGAFRRFLNGLDDVEGSIPHKRQEIAQYLKQGARDRDEHFIIRQRIEASPIANELQQRLGWESWNDLVFDCASIPDDHAFVGKKPSDTGDRVQRLARDLRTFATHLRELEAASRPDGLPTRLDGLVAQYVFSEAWMTALESVGRWLSPAPAVEVIKQAFLGLYLAQPADLLANLSLAYADALERQPLGDAYRRAAQHAGRRNSLKDYAKRRVFRALKARWPLRRAPNRESAELVNLVLHLHERDAVSANEISQMNRGSRRRYATEK